MNKSDIQVMPAFFDRYIHKVKQENLFDAFQTETAYLESYNLKLLESLGDSTYAPGKWTVKDILQHIIDNERIQSYRALRFARNDKTLLPGYDEKGLGQYADPGRRTIQELFKELLLLRSSTLLLFQSFDDTMMQREGICFNIQISVLALGFKIIGHQIHHFEVIQERYLPLLK